LKRHSKTSKHQKRSLPPVIMTAEGFSLCKTKNKLKIYPM